MTGYMTLYERAMLRAASLVIRLLIVLVQRQHVGSGVTFEEEALAYAKRLDDVAEKGQ
jgi:hypothetical protein